MSIFLYGEQCTEAHRICSAICGERKVPTSKRRAHHYCTKTIETSACLRRPFKTIGSPESPQAGGPPTETGMRPPPLFTFPWSLMTPSTLGAMDSSVRLGAGCVSKSLTLDTTAQSRRQASSACPCQACAACKESERPQGWGPPPPPPPLLRPQSSLWSLWCRQLGTLGLLLGAAGLALLEC